MPDGDSHSLGRPRRLAEWSGEDPQYEWGTPMACSRTQIPTFRREDVYCTALRACWRKSGRPLSISADLPGTDEILFCSRPSIWRTSCRIQPAPPTAINAFVDWPFSHLFGGISLLRRQ